LVTQRMKRSGMAWAKAGGQGILTLRSLIQSERWTSAWALLRTVFCKQVAELKTTKTSGTAVCAIHKRILVSASFGYISRTVVLTVSELHPYDYVIARAFLFFARSNPCMDMEIASLERADALLAMTCYFVAKMPPTTLVITNLPSRSNHFFATASILPIKASYSSLPLNMDIHSLRSSPSEART